MTQILWLPFINVDINVALLAEAIISQMLRLMDLSL